MPLNNPFSQQPQSVVDQTAQRFPDVLNSDPDLRQQPYSSPPPQQPYLQSQPTGMYQQQQQLYAQQTGYQYQPQQQQSYGGGGQLGYGGGAYQQSPSNQQYSGGQYQQSYNTADLDPYASLGAIGQRGPQQSNSTASSSSPSTALLQVTQSQSHPRQFVQENKTGLMSWDEYSWRQLFTRVDALREAWEQRVAGIKAAANQGADPTSVDHLRRDAESNVDSIHAAKMQMSEVKSGWKHSTDPASKARVREALNAGLSAMPEYPSPVSLESLGGAFYRNVSEQQRKSTIMSQFTGAQPPPQQQPMPTGYGGYGGIQPQQTGYGGYGGQVYGGGGGGGGYGQPNYGGSMQMQQTGYGGGYPQGGNQQYYG